MKKNMMKVAAFAIVMTALTSFTACSNDESMMENESALATMAPTPSMVSVNRLDGIVEIPVNISGSWTAELKESADGELPWAGIVQGQGKGPATLKVGYDYFSPRLQQQERVAEIIVRSGEQTQTIRLRQYIGLKDGEAAPNDNGIFYDLWRDKGMGRGFDPLTGKQTHGSIINISGIKSLAAQFPKYGEMMRQNPIVDARSNIELVESIEDNLVGLGAKAHMDISYALFKFDLDVKYNNTGKQLRNPQTYIAEQKMTFLESQLDHTFLTTAIMDDPALEGQIAPKMMSYGFKAQYQKLMKAHNDGNDDEFEKQVRKMLDTFGPIIITDTELGGSLTIAIKYDELTTKDSLKVNGKATAKMDLGILSIDAGVDATYSRNGLDFMMESSHAILCDGGSQQAALALSSLLNQDKADPDAVVEAMKTWTGSIFSLASCESGDSSDNSKKDNTAIIAFDYMPIWSLFPLEVALKMEQFVVDFYQDKNTLIDMKRFVMSEDE
jgi:hypothetical protein